MEVTQDLSKGEKTKIRIIESAIRLYFEFGTESVSFQKIATKSKLTQPAIYSYFDNKTSLLAACGAYAAEMGRQYIAAQIDPRDPARKQLQCYVHANIDWFAKHRREAYALMSIYHFAHRSKIIMNLQKATEEAGIQKIEVFVRQGEYSRQWEVKNPAVTARQIHSFLVGEVFKQFFRPEEVSIQKRKKIVYQGTLSFLEQK